MTLKHKLLQLEIIFLILVALALLPPQFEGITGMAVVNGNLSSGIENTTSIENITLELNNATLNLSLNNQETNISTINTSIAQTNNSINITTEETEKQRGRLMIKGLLKAVLSKKQKRIEKIEIPKGQTLKLKIEPKKQFQIKILNYCLWPRNKIKK